MQFVILSTIFVLTKARTILRLIIAIGTSIACFIARPRTTTLTGKITIYTTQ